MSRTDKDRPYYVKVMDETLGSLEQHDHRYGYCVVEPGPWWHHRHLSFKNSRSHFKNCNKRLEGTWFCTRKNPVRRWGYRQSQCWTPIRCGEFPYEYTVGYTPCEGHRDVGWEPGNPCICDDFEPIPMCGYELPAKTKLHWYDGGVPQYFIDHTWNNPERVRERDELRKAAALYNGGDWEDEEFDFDFPNYPHRHRSTYYYW